MIRFALKIGLLLVAGILIYNYFWGTDSEKDTSRKVFGQMRDVVVSVGQLVKSEKTKFDAGKYDAALEQLGGAYKAVRERAQHLDASLLQRLDDLEKRKAALNQELESVTQGEQTSAAPAPSGKKTLKANPKAEQEKAAKAAEQERRKEALNRELAELLRDSEALMRQAQEQ